MEKVYGDSSFHLPWPLYVAGMMPIYIGRHGGQVHEPVSTNLVIGSTTVLCTPAAVIFLLFTTQVTALECLSLNTVQSL